MLSDERLRSASDLLWRHWADGSLLKSLPQDLRPQTREEGYAIQAQLDRRTRSPLFGWKIAATSIAGQRHINVDGPMAGRLLKEKAFGNGAVLPLGANHMRVAEPEFAFRMARDLGPHSSPYTAAEVLDAVASLHPAIEIPDSRFEDFTAVGAAQLIADNACAHLFVLGEKAPESWRDGDLAQHAVHGTVRGKIERDGRGDNVLAGPLDALLWLANELSGLGLTLRAGEVVTTGTCMTPLAIEQGDEVLADFGALGQVSVRIT
jgi:2-keto-4-pentenoate hydratase